MADISNHSDIRILVAEDEPAVREFIVRGLQSSLYNVTAVEDGQQALEKLAALNEAGETTPYHLLITDIVMPQLDGIALALKASRDYPDMKIIMISGYADARAHAHNLDALIHFVMAKPFTLLDLLNQVQGALKSA